MKVEIKGNECIITREQDDPRFKDGGFAGGNAGESRLLYHVKNILNKRGYDLIKKRMWRDGHMVDDLQQYLRTRKPTGDPNKDIYIYNNFWQIRGAEEDFNKDGQVILSIGTDIFKED